ncbi:sensor histidine kinase [Actinophytocola gossypii]|uniref:histidine kinase n=1 Tax=Actinophytocola gossypii TaxID=2812003 RepID=A0ABT2JKD2_9PSEU|nr:histidine kinase [Actinophytocola gossypii]MCT2588241.1 two-component sensor histidine kinase [Actinophytocola gossypii]
MTRGMATVPSELWRDLNPMAGAPLRRWHAPRLPWAGWLPHTLVLAGAVVVGVLAWRAVSSAAPDAGQGAVLLGALQGVPLVLCLYRPMAGWWVSLIAGMLVSEVSRAGALGPVWAEPAVLAHLGVLALVALRTRPRVLVEMWLLTLLAGAILVQRMPAGYDATDLLELSALSAVALLTAGALRGRGEARRRLAEQERVSATERERRAMLEERSRIARELHDVLAHHMSVIAIQAEAAPYRVTDPPHPLTRSFATIHSHATDALIELRRVLGVLRATEPTAETAAPIAPQPTLRDVDVLVAGARAAGLTPVVAVTGTPRPMPPGLELSAYRILQEALSNVMRHAPGAEVDLEIAYQPSTLRLRVRNGPPSSPPAPSTGTGHGMLGMRERTAMLDGRLTTSPLPDGGYLVTAVLPERKGEGS